MDGFRWDYFDQQNLDFPGFRRMFKTGVKAEYMIPDFPSLSYPNYYSIMTGLHVESHGMVGNFMYDEKHKQKFLAGINVAHKHPFWWDDGEPLWVSAEKQNKRVHMYYWPGCEAVIRGVKPTYCREYNILLTPHVRQMKNAIIESIPLFKNDSADVVGIYLETPDKYGHKYGVNSEKLNHALEEVDQGVMFLQNKLKENGLEDKVNVMIFSDHGMTNVSDSRVVNLTTVIDMADIDVIMDSGPTVYVWPKNNKIDKVYNDIKRFRHPRLQVYQKEEIPERWFCRHHYRIPPILLVADSGWYIVHPTLKQIFSYFDSGQMRGHHGYDNIGKDMRAIFVANGPDFKTNMIAKPFHNVHLYQIMCHILDIKAAPNNGSWSHVREMLRYPPAVPVTKPPINPSSSTVTKEGVKSNASSFKCQSDLKLCFNMMLLLLVVSFIKKSVKQLV
ncbi:hypothetical protein FSP39_013757 [Pinctada imbricata]|uniref:glycerophosphocholine cholinephosphodiesterase n=1 Tax=Pinctada imbricata TaxID=66713 RepID=A0AA88YSM0_PINIB|nr:hypothetical protein FSP39_013757 [Pinctada imbricata]